MRISRRTSGGRGEYEISEETAGGLRPVDLLGRRLHLDLGDRTFDTATILTMQGGKPRIRRVNQAAQSIQLPRQLAAALMLPHPVRQDAALGAGLPILRTNRYAIEQITLKDVVIQQHAARLIVDEVILRNNSNFANFLVFAARVARVRSVWAKANQLPTIIRDLLIAHQSAVVAPGPIVRDAEDVVSSLQSQVTASAEDLGLAYRSIDEDVLEHLEQALSLTAQPPAPPVAVDQIDPEETVVRRRDPQTMETLWTSTWRSKRSVQTASTNSLQRYVRGLRRLPSRHECECSSRCRCGTHPAVGSIPPRRGIQWALLM